jgi:hypothetical protein
MPAANRYTTTELLADIKRTGHVVSSQNTFANTDLLRLADFELQTSILRMILSARENFYLTYKDFSAASDYLYQIPLRAIGGAIADVQYVNGTTVCQIVRTEVAEQFATNASSNGMYSFYIKGNYLVIPGLTSGTVRVWYYTRPNTLVVSTAGCQITGIASNVLTFDASTIPSTISTSTPCDLIKDQPGFDGLSLDVTPSAVGATTITFAAADVPSTLAVGDWVCLAGQTVVPQIPVEFTPLLVQRVVVKYYEIQGYMDKMKAAEAKLKEMSEDVLAIINPRVAEAPKRIVASADLIGGSRRWRTPASP